MKENALRIIKLALVLLMIRCASPEKEIDKAVFDKYVRTNLWNSDSIIDYKIENGKLWLKFRGFPDVKKWHVLINDYNFSECPVDNSGRVSLIADNLDDSSTFNVCLMPHDNRIFYNSNDGSRELFVYKSYPDEKVIRQLNPRNMFSLDVNVYKDVKDSFQLKCFLDSLNTMLAPSWQLSTKKKPSWY